MFKDVQQLRVAELKAQLESVKAKKTELESDVLNLREKLNDLNQQQAQGISGYQGKQKFSFLERALTKRKEYRAYQAKLAALKKLPQRIAALTSEIEIAELQAKDKIASSGVLEQINDAEQAVLDAEKTTTLAQLGIAPADAVTMLEQNGITPLLDESDREIFERPRDYRRKSDLIAVHKMDIMPTGDRLSTVGEEHVQKTDKITLDGKEYQYSYELQRNTMHVSLNDEVSSHLAGNWDNCHYTVLQPFDEIENNQIGSAMPNDTYTRGGIALSKNAWILCPADEVEAAKQQNPGVHVLGYKGENSKGLAAPFLSQLGYRAESVGQWGWSDQESQKQFHEMMECRGIQEIQHDNSTDAEDEEFQIATNKVIALIKMLRDENLMQTPQDYLRLKPQLEQQTDLSQLLNKVMAPTQVADEIAKNWRNRDAIVAQGQNVRAFVNKMSRAGMPLSKDEIFALQTRMDDQREGTNNAAYYNAGKEFKPDELIERVLVNNALRSRTLETDHQM